MSFTPKKNQKGALLALFLALLGAFCVLLIPRVTAFWMGCAAIFALFLLLFSFEVMYRYVLTDFTYIISESEFAVIRRVGNKRRTVCALPLDTALCLTKAPKKKEKRAIEREYGGVAFRYNFAATLRPKRRYSVFFAYENKVAELILELNEDFLQCFSKRLEENEGASAF